MLKTISVQNSVSMCKQLFTCLLFIIPHFLKAQSQLHFKQQKHRTVSIIGGYQFISNKASLNSNLTSNNFTSLSTPHFLFGIEIGGVAKKNILKTEFFSTGQFVSKNIHQSTLVTSGVSFKYGRDILDHADRTFLYPFAGYNLFVCRLYGQSGDTKKLNATKIDFGLVTGIGFKYFFKRDIMSFFSSIDFSSGLTLNLIKGKWKNEGSQYLAGTKTLQPLYFFTAAIGF